MIAVTPSTHQMVARAGALAVTVALLLTLVVVVLRLLALPFAVAVSVLDRAAGFAAVPLTFTASPDGRARR